MKKAIELIAEERQRQIEKEGYTLAHDDEHTGGEIAFAAAIYATPTILYEKEDEYVNQTRFVAANMKQYDWNLDLLYNGNVQLDNNKLAKTKRIRQLVKAGALITAEIERLQRADG